MKLIQSLLQERAGKDDLSRLPEDVISAIRSNIRNGAKDLQQMWANALELVHKAYQREGVQRPVPNMAAAWKQYEENILYAVQQLAKYRGMDSDWRMSSTMFHEAKKPVERYRVIIESNGTITEEDYEGMSTTAIVSLMADKFGADPESITTRSGTTVTFSRWGVKDKGTKVKIVAI